MACVAAVGETALRSAGGFRYSASRPALRRAGRARRAFKNAQDRRGPAIKTVPAVSFTHEVLAGRAT
eukprot:6960329-Alexandrium_andersonii.AAC.1